MQKVQKSVYQAFFLKSIQTIYLTTAHVTKVLKILVLLILLSQIVR